MKLEIGKHYTVKVVKILERGVVVSMEDDTTEFIHISKISPRFVKNIVDFVSVDTVYDAEAVEGVAHPVELSLRHLNLTPMNYQKPKDNDHKPRNNYNKSSHKPATLDDMIKASENDLKDKLATQNNPKNRK